LARGWEGGREGGECSQSRKAVGKPTVFAKYIMDFQSVMKNVVAISVLGMHPSGGAMRLPKQMALSTSLSLSAARGTLYKIRYVDYL